MRTLHLETDIVEIFRYSRDAWGQQTLEGVSFELFWVFFGVALTVIVVHSVYKFFAKKTAQ